MFLSDDQLPNDAEEKGDVGYCQGEPSKQRGVPRFDA